MTPRQRFIETLTFGNPDKIPFIPGYGRQSTKARWYKEGLPEGKDPIMHVCEILNIEMELTKPKIDLDIDFKLIPQFEEKVLEHKNGHYICQDWKGNICEISDEFDVTYLRTAIDFVTRRWIKCPVETRDDWEQLKQRYRLESSGRFPEDFVEKCKQTEDRDWVLGIAFSGPFWILREWCGFEGLCMMMIEKPDLIEEMAEFWENFIAEMLNQIFEHITPDYIHISEDMAYKAKAMISMDMTRRFCMPSWKRWTKQAKQAGVPVIDIDSDGFIGELIPLWIESGINVCDPVEVAAHCDINAFRKEHGHKMAYKGGVDKRCMAKGGSVIREEMKRLEPVIHDGGFIPSCDHGVPSDVSWQDFVDYCELLAQTTGWK